MPADRSAVTTSAVIWSTASDWAASMTAVPATSAMPEG